MLRMGRTEKGKRKINVTGAGREEFEDEYGGKVRGFGGFFLSLPEKLQEPGKESAA